MKGRQPGRPGGVILTLDNGQVLRGILTRDDQPIVEGHALNPYNLLKDTTCKMLGGDPNTMVPDDALQILAALASSGGGGGDGGGFEDTDMEVGTITNSGAGWNTYHFREPFEAVPLVFLMPVDFSGTVEVKEVNTDGFLYCLRNQTPAGITTETVYTGSGTGTSPSHTAKTVVTGLSTLLGATTAEAAKINYIAIDYGGER